MTNIDSDKLEYRLMRSKDYLKLKEFDCGNSSMNTFLIHDAYFYTITKEASTSLIIFNSTVVGYFTIQRRKIVGLTEELFGDTSLFIQRLAVDKRYQCHGIGEKAIKHIFSMANTFNDRFIFLDALIEKIDWYKDTLKFVPVISDEEIRSNKDGLVLMFIDLYDEHLVSDFLGIDEEDLLEY